MQEGDIEFSMYQTAVKHFRPPLIIKQAVQEINFFMPASDIDIYTVKDDVEQLLAIFKVFEAEDENEVRQVEQMIRAIRLLGSQSYVNLSISTPMDFQKANVEANNEQYIALFTMPEGKTLSTHIHYLGQQREYSLERGQAFEILKSGYRQLALAFSELHTKKYSPVCKIASFYWKFHMDTCRALVNTMKGYADDIPFNLFEFSDKLIKLAAMAYSKPCSAAFLHGSPMPISISYEPFNGILAFTNMEEAYHSISDKGVPCGPSAYDFIFAEEAFELQMNMIEAPLDEIQDIRYEYRMLYKENMRERFPAAHHQCFYAVLFWLPIYKWFLIRYAGVESDMKDYEVLVYRSALSKIQAVLNFPMDK